MGTKTDEIQLTPCKYCGGKVEIIQFPDGRWIGRCKTMRTYRCMSSKNTVIGKKDDIPALWNALAKMN